MDSDVRAFFDAANFCHVSTLKRDGSIHSVIVWAHTEDGAVVLNGVLGRDWVANLQRDPRTTLVAWDKKDPRNYARINGVLVHQDTTDADRHIDFLASKYEGTERYPYGNAGEIRIKLYVEPKQSFVFVGGSSDSQIRRTED